ncbi:MAG: Hsp70 family protein [Ruminococcus sp.]|nr:Hsp70 family protein [Ruminococcus sp.]
MSIVGIDFGMENIKVSVVMGKIIKTLNLDSRMGDIHVSPNVVYYKKNENGGIEKYFFGSKEANQGRILFEDDYIRHSKRLLRLENWEKSICDNSAVVTIDGVLSDIFSAAKNRIVQETIDDKIDAVITVPVNFTEAQKHRLSANAEHAGINVINIITEPFAALFSKDIIAKIENIQTRKNVAVFDFGGSTLDICAAAVIPENGALRIEILGSAGMNYGGVDITNDMYEHIVFPFFEDVADAEMNDMTMKNSFYKEIEAAKRNLFSEDSYDDDVTDITYKGKRLEMSRKTFDDFLREQGIDTKIKNMFDDMLDSINEDSFCDDLEYSDFSDVFMIGGTSRMPFFQDLVREIFGDDDIIDEDILDDDENLYNSVANGAAAFPGCSEQFRVSQKLSMSIGIDRGRGYEILLNKNVTYGEKSALKTIPIDFLKKNNGMIKIYQSASDRLIYGKCYDVDDEDILFSGIVKIDTELYDNSRDIGIECYNTPKSVMIDTYQNNGEQCIERIALTFV